VVVLLGRVSTGGVEQDRFVGEPPVAVARAADAANAAAARIEEGKLEPGVLERGGLPGAGGPDDDVPGERIERARPADADLRGLDRSDPFLDLLLQLDDFGAAIGAGVGGLLLRLPHDLAL